MSHGPHPGSIENPPKRTVDQARSLFTNDKIKTFTKLQIQKYIESFFNEQGHNRDLLSAVSPRFINYNIDRSFDPSLDPTQRKLQIARYFNELRAIIPAILIVDGGVVNVPDTIGQIAKATVHGSTWRGYYPIVRRVPLTVLAAARDVEEADEMAGLISLMFNEMRNIAGGHYIAGNAEQGENWVVTLPNGAVDVGALSDVEVTDDNIDKIWYSETTIEVMFEDVLAIKADMPTVDECFGTTTNATAVSSNRPSILAPDAMSLNEQITIQVSNWQPHYRLIVSDPKIATLSYRQVLTPRSYGDVTIKVVNGRDLHPDRHVLTTKTITVT